MAAIRDIRWLKHRGCVERWKVRHRERYLEQKRMLAGRPEYLERRREMYHLKKARPTTEFPSLSTCKLYDDIETPNESGA